MGNRGRVVEWTGVEGNGGKCAGGKIRYWCYSGYYLNGEDKDFWSFVTFGPCHESKPKIKKKTVKPSNAKVFVKSIEQVKSLRKITVKQGKARMETVPGKDYILLPLWTADLLISKESKSSQNDGFQPLIDDGKKVNEDPRQESKCKDQKKEDNVNNTNNVNVAGTNGVYAVGANTNNELPFDIGIS
nr:hypothetical protein [Tanacetum cinerariifolium]